MIKRSINIKGELHSFDKPLVMGIVNMTPDSFFDGGKYNNLDQAKLRVEKMVKEGVKKLTLAGCLIKNSGTSLIIEKEPKN